MIDENSQENPTFALVRILNKTKLIFCHEYDPNDDYKYNKDLIAKHFIPTDLNSYQVAYWALKTMSFKSMVTLPYDKLLKLCLEVPTTIHVDQSTQKYLMKIVTLCVRKLFKRKETNQNFFTRFGIACEKLTTELIGYYDQKKYLQITHDQFNIKSALDEIYQIRLIILKNQ